MATINSELKFNYTGAKVLVTGGSNGIGLACAHGYRDAGAEVVVTGRKSSADAYESDLSGMRYQQLLLSDHGAIASFCAEFKTLDILINNAGGLQDAQDDEWHVDGFDAAVALNLTSVHRISMGLLDALKKSTAVGGGNVVSIASLTSFFGNAFTPGYGAAKAGLVQLMKCYAVTWGEHTVRTNAVAAGLVATNLTRMAITEMSDLVVKPMMQRQAIKRLGTPEDIAAAVLFLSSAQASWISGQTIVVDGGFSIAH